MRMSRSRRAVAACVFAVWAAGAAVAAPEDPGTGETAELLRGLTDRRVQFDLVVGNERIFKDDVNYSQVTFRFVREGFFIIDARQRRITFIRYASVQSVSIHDFQEGMIVLSDL